MRTPIPQRTIFQRVESIPVMVVFEPSKTVKLDLVDPQTDTVIVADLDLAELVGSLPDQGVYFRFLTPDELDGWLGAGAETDRLVLWRARLDPAEDEVDDEFGTFFRGGHVDEWQASRAPIVRFAPTPNDALGVRENMVSGVDYPIGHGKALRQTFVYRPGSDDVAEVLTELVDA